MNGTITKYSVIRRLSRPLYVRCFILLLTLFSGCLGLQAGLTIRVQGSRGGNQIPVGSTFYITYTLTNTEGEPKAPASVPGGRLMYFTLTGQSSSFTSVNGRTSQSVSLTYTATCRAEKEGSYKFGPVTVGDQRSNEVSYQIVSAEAAARAQGGPAAGNGRQGSRTQGDPYGQGRAQSDEPTFIGKGNDKLFLRASVSKTNAYEQEALVYTVKLYSTYTPIKFIGATDAPKFDGFVIEESDDISRQLNYETYEGRQYATAIIARYIIFPQMAGKLVIKGNTYTVSTDEQEYYSDPYYSTMTVRRPIQLNVTPNDLTVNVRELPSPRPADFSGGVGQFRITSSLPSSDFASNQAASISYEVSGAGNLKYIHLPDLNSLYPKQLEVYSPSVDVQASVGSANVNGKVVYDCSFLPLEPGHFNIPAVTLTYFNPATGQYEKTTAKGYSINVARGKESEKSQTRSTRAFDKKLLVPDPLAKIHTPLIDRFSYWLCYILSSLILGGIVWYYRKIVALKADQMGLRSRKAAKIATRRLRRAADCMKRDNKDKFYEEMLKALWGYVSDKLKIPTSDLTKENVVAKLEASGVSQPTVASFLKLVEDCEFSKYSSNQGDLTMQQIYDEGADVINQMASSFKKRPVPDLGHV